jgi:hypothetical protein
MVGVEAREAEYSNLLWCFVLRLAKYRLRIVLVKVSINTYNTFGNRRVRMRRTYLRG